MIDRSKVKKMLVWNSDIKYKEKRYVIDIFKNGSCLYVSKESEKEFEADGPYRILSSSHCMEVPKDKYRPFKAEEITEEFLDYLFRMRVGNGQISKCTTVSSESGSIYLAGCWTTIDELYEDWEIKKLVYSVNDDGIVTKTYTDWMSAGVKE